MRGTKNIQLNMNPTASFAWKLILFQNLRLININYMHHTLYSGIQRDKTMTDKLMKIPIDNAQNYPFLDYN